MELFKGFNSYVCDEIEKICLENKIELKKKIIDELNRLDEYIINKLSEEDKIKLDRVKGKINLFSEIINFYNEKINIFNKYYNNYVNDILSEYKHEKIINHIRNIYVNKLCEYISDINNIELDMIDLYINFCSYFDKFKCYDNIEDIIKKN